MEGLTKKNSVNNTIGEELKLESKIKEELKSESKKY